ncbi:MAG: transglutaminaseTgpA domain-containing protein [Pelovirga sp.]
MNKLQRTVYLLLYMAAFIAIVPVFPFLELWVQFFLACGLVIGLARQRFSWGKRSGRVAMLITAVAVIVSGAQLSAADVAVPLIQILCVLLAARLASEKTPRTMLQTFALALTLLAASSLLTLNMAYLVYLVVLILILSSSLILLSFIHVDPEIQVSSKAMKGLRFFLMIVPATTLVLMSALFFLLPRTPTPLWNIAGQELAAVAGMTDQVRPGSFSDLQSTGDIAFRAEIDELPPLLLYWRGIVLDQLDDQIWRRSNHQAQEQFKSDDSFRWEYVIYAEPKSDPYLVTLDRTEQLRGISHRKQSNGVFVRQHQGHRRTTYRGVARPEAVAELEGNPDHYLTVPSSSFARLREVAVELGSEPQDFAGRLERLEAFFLQQQLTYSAADLPQTQFPLATFLFESRRGYCEHFASTFAVMLRLMDIPSRLVGGYLGGEYNQFGKFYLVTEDRAHVWVEALNDQGEWVRIDPSRLAVNADQTFSVSGTGRSYWQSLVDALYHSWTRRVLNFDLRQQFELVREASNKLAGLRRIEFSMLPSVLSLLLIAIIFSAIFLIRRRVKNAGLIQSYLRRLADCAGLEMIPPELGLYQLAELCDEPLCREFATCYGGAVYIGRTLERDERRRLKQIVRQLKGRRLVIEVALPEGLGDNREPHGQFFIDQKGKQHAIH